MNQKRETDLREDLRFFLARSGVSGFTRPDEFDLCGCYCCEEPRLDRTIRVRWSHTLAHLRPIGRGDVLLRHFNPHRWSGPDDLRVTRALILRHGRLDCLEVGKDYLFPWFMTEIQFPNTWLCGFDCIPIYGDIVVWGIMPSMIDTYHLKLFYTIYTYNSIKWFV